MYILAERSWFSLTISARAVLSRSLYKVFPLLMDNPKYSDFSLDRFNTMDGIVKQEPVQEMGAASASVPIPGGHRGTRGVYDQFSPSPLTASSGWTMRTEHMESPFKMDPDQLDISFRMDDDDIFQVDKAELIQGPTLAELNANDDTLLGDLNFDDLLLPEERVQPIKVEANAPSCSSITGSLFSSSDVGFAPSSFPQSGLTFRSCPTYTNTYGFNLNKGSNIVDNVEAVSPTAFPSPGTSNIAGMSFLYIFIYIIFLGNSDIKCKTILLNA